ncbi:Zinc finger, C2H2 [Corchorus capsularis]|uniref:Zinc finger, C2H2 n=1 Tax=Corchorus capsularis TaxID=210143 RepID=A0A1R3GRN2_COCAP|nr:Zinc finger, C2H2 [Corchorus capsularis]
MAASSSSGAAFFGIREEDQNNQMKQQQQPQHSSTTPTNSSSGPPPPPQAPPPQKKKRNQPDPDAEVIALSPKTLMATNRFICEVCNKGFQREQNLQLHRRGHNLPWKLRQKTTKEVKRKVYLCPEPTCVHHDPSRALGDLTGIKKHFSRKHGEKKWKCEKCSKRYAVQSDWKAHSKTCGTREYRCDCGTLFSRRDSFITHRAFCDALAQESARHPPSLNPIANHLYGNSSLNLSQQVGSQISSIHHQDQNNKSAGDILRLGGAASRNTQFDHFLPPSAMGSSSTSSFRSHHHHQQSMIPSAAGFFINPDSNNNPSFPGLMQFQDHHNNSPSAANLFNLGFSNNNNNGTGNSDNSLSSSGLLMSDHFNSGNSHDIMGDHQIPSLFSSSVQNNNNMAVTQMSATALLQKAAQMGSTSSSNSASLLSSFGSSSSTTSTKPSNYGGILGDHSGGNNLHELINSIASGNSSIFGTAPGGVNTYSGAEKQQQNLNAASGGGGSDRLTRDFLGVGQILRSMSGGGGTVSPQQQQGMGSKRNNMTVPPPQPPPQQTEQQSFEGGGNFQ